MSKYDSNSMFNDTAGPMWNQYGVRLGYVGPDAGRMLAAYMYPTAVSQLQSANALETPRQQILNQVLANSSWGNQMAQTDRNNQAIANNYTGQANQQAAALRAQGMSPEYANAMRMSMMANAQHAQNQNLASENQRFNDAQNSALAGIYQAQEAPAAQQELPYLNFLESMRQESQNRKAAGQSSPLGSVLSLAGTAAGLGWRPLKTGP